MRICIKLLIAVFAAILLMPCMLTAYNIGGDDVLNIVVVGMDKESDFSGRYTVSPEGTINVPMAGKISVVGKTLEDVQTEITSLLSKRLVNPEVYVNIEQATNNNVYVIGALAKSGAYQYKNGMGLAEIIAMAGDVNKLADYQTTNDIIVTVKSLDGSSLTIKYSEVVACDYKVKSGDVITIDMANAVNVNVIGSVKLPGYVRLAGKTANLITAVSAAGGFTENANYAQIKLYSPTGELKIVDYTKAMLNTADSKLENIVLEDNSTIVVPEYNFGITVLGWVKNPGYYKVKPGDTYRLTEAIALAGGGVQNKARYNNVAVIGPGGTEADAKVYNYNSYVKLQDMTQNPLIKPGDIVFVPCTKAIDWQVVISSISNVIRSISDIDDIIE